MTILLRNDAAFSLFRSAAACIWMWILMVAMLQPELETLAGIRILKIAADLHVTWLLHIAAFCLLYVVWCWALIPHFDPSSAKFMALLVTLILGVAGEFAQSIIPGRHTSAVDLLANGIGIGLAWFGLRIWTRAFLRGFDAP